MRIAVISDLHLGRGGPADDFGHDDESFLHFLDDLDAKLRGTTPAQLEARPIRSALELANRRGVPARCIRAGDEDSRA